MLHRKFRKKLFGDDRAEERRNTNPYFCVSAAGNIVRTLAVIVEGFQELSVRSLNPSPTTVSRSRLFTRSNSFAPSSFSRLLIAAVIDGCEIWHTSDALVILPYLHVSRKYCKWFRFISVLSGCSPNPTTTLSLMTSICEIYTKSKQHNRAFLY